MNIYIVNPTESGIIEGDEIGVFDGNICVGSAKISNLQSLIVNQNSVSIPVSAADGIDSDNGYSVGNPISIKMYRNGKEYPLTIEPLNNSKAVFEKGSSSFARVNIATGTEGILNSNFTKISCYPNPFGEEVTIEIKLVKDSDVQVEVLNQLGQKVKIVTTKQIMLGGLHKLIWNGRNENNSQVSHGIYYLYVGIDDLVYYRKIIFLK
jgi:hypothetical protein